MAAEYNLFDPVEDGIPDREQAFDDFKRGRVTTPVMYYDRLNDARQVASTLEGATESARKIILGATALQDAGSHTERYHASQEMVHAGLEHFGPMNTEFFNRAIIPELYLLEDFKPGNLHAEMIRDSVATHLEVSAQSDQGTGKTEIISQEIIERAREGVLTYLKPILDVMPKEGTFDAHQIAEYMTLALDAMGLSQKGWVVEIDASITIMKTASKDKKIRIPASFKKSALDIARLSAHEIGVHASKEVTLDDDFEEGIAMLVESVVAPAVKGAEPVAVKRARKRYLHDGLALGVDGTLRNARQVFEITWKLEAMLLAKDTGIISPQIEEKAKSNTKAHIENIFRGTDYGIPGVVYPKAKLYFEGIIQAVDHADEHADDPLWLTRLLRPNDIQQEGGGA